MESMLTIARETSELVALLDESLTSDPPSTSLPSDERIFVNRIPKEVIEASDPRYPPKMVVLRQAGGGSKLDLSPIDVQTIDVLCYGESDREADRVRRAIWSRLTFLQRECVAGVLLHAINPTTGTIPNVDPEIKWPAVAQSFSVVADVVSEV